jgi:hypothetical protein
MGCNAQYFSCKVSEWLKAGWLRSGGRLMDFGSQEFVDDASSVREATAAWLRSHYLSPEVVQAAVGDDMPSVRSVYQAIGIEYESVDVDLAHGSVFLDLNNETAPPNWLGAFDFVNNEGTAEHLINPINAFHVAHDLAKVGGVVRHSFPLIGWREHGFFYGTTKLYAHVVGDNGYEVLRACAIVTSTATPFDDKFFVEVVDHDLKPLRAPTIVDVWGELIYRKTKDTPFVIPVDHLSGRHAGAAKVRLRANYDRIARMR